MLNLLHRVMRRRRPRAATPAGHAPAPSGRVSPLAPVPYRRRPVRGGHPGYVVNYGPGYRRVVLFQKKHWRALVGLLKPVTCPTCRQRTRQVAEAEHARRCLGCQTVFAEGRVIQGPAW